jgi:hypothetical protein
MTDNGGIIGKNNIPTTDTASGVWGLRQVFNAVSDSIWPGSVSSLYDFTSVTFTPGGNTGRTGPSLSQVQSGITASPDDSWKNDTQFLDVSGGIIEWPVPKNGIYKIKTRGGRGGRDTEPGNAAVMEGDFSLSFGDKLKILVGQKGVPDEKDGTAAGGGGGTFVTLVDDTPLIIAGGGGGADGGPDGQDASTGEDGVDDPQGGAGGTNGSGGQEDPSGGSGGGGLLGDGGDGSSSNGGQAFINGGLGGDGVRDGGFGGGGGSAGSSNGGGGGGGYSGGGGGDGSSSPDAGGGGSFNSGTNQSNSIFSDSSNPYDGYVEITLLTV